MPIPQDVLDEWERCPISAEKGPGNREVIAKTRPKPEKGLSCTTASPPFSNRQKLKLNPKMNRRVIQDTEAQGTEKGHGVSSSPKQMVLTHYFPTPALTHINFP
jgi:hypothetical protein